MSKRKSEEQIIALLKRAEAGEPIADLCRQEGIGVSTFYKWRSKYDGLEASEGNSHCQASAQPALGYLRASA